MPAAFRKMHGLGNDFVVFDARGTPFRADSQRIRELADRRKGIGFDQLLVLEPPRSNHASASYRIFNADGSEAGQCGNGARCLALLVSRESGFSGEEVVLDGPSTTIRARVRQDNQVTVNMGEPVFDPARVPFEADDERDRYALELSEGVIEVGVVSMGNPHAVLTWDDIEIAPVHRIGAEISAHPRFPRQSNVEFMQIVDPGHIRLRVYERGVGETRACGSGACGAVAAGRNWGVLEDTVEVALPGGSLTIGWPGRGHDLWMTGPAVDVFGGHVDL